MSKLGLVLKGAAMGIAEVIPGVSGGTIAFITGVYEDLIDSIKALGPEALNGYRKDGFKGVWAAFNGDFLVWLLLGMAMGLLGGIFGVTFLIDNYPEPLWAFFFGLILASAVYIARQVTVWSLVSIVAVILGAIIAYGITVLSPSEGSLNPLYVFFSGAIAISALMLPGISGSFILLIMGMYTLIVPLIKKTLSTFDIAGLVTIGIFGLGCLTGLVVFSRLLSWLFKKYKNETLALLTGFLLGALNKVWPWRNITSILDKNNGKIISIDSEDKLSQLNIESFKVITESNVFPTNYWGENSMAFVCAMIFVLGIVLVYLLARFSNEE